MGPMMMMKLAGAAANVVGSFMQASQEKKIARQQQQLDMQRAQREQEIGALNAKRQRQENERMLSMQTALRAGSGGATSRGSSLLITEDTAREGEFSAALEEANATTKAKAIRDQSNINYAAARSKANAGVTSSIFRTGSKLLTSGAGKSLFG